MAGRIFSSRNKTLLIFRLVCPVKYRRKIFTSETEQTLKAICLELAPRYNHAFLEIGIDEDRVHFLVQTVPNILLSDMVKAIKSLTDVEMFKRHPEVKIFLRGSLLK